VLNDEYRGLNIIQNMESVRCSFSLQSTVLACVSTFISGLLTPNVLRRIIIPLK
jgi:hypothetical protein